MPPEMAQAMSVAEGSIMVIYPCKDIVEIEVIPPLSPEMQAHMDEILEDSKELFEELKRLGD